MNWQPLFTRNYSLLRWAEYVEALDEPILLKISAVKNVNLIIDGFKIPQTVYFQPVLWSKNIAQPIFNYCLKFQNWKNFVANYWRLADSLINWVKRAKKIEVKNFTNNQLIKEIIYLRKILLPYFAIGIWGVWILERELTSTEFLNKNFSHLAKLEIDAILTPPKLAAHFKEEMALKKLNLKDKKAVKKHLDKWQWIPCVNLEDFPWSEKDLIKRKKIIIKQKSLVDFKQRNINLRRYRDLLKKLSTKQKKPAQTIHELIYLKDHRDDIRFYLTFFAKNLYQQIAKKFSLDICQLSVFTDQEIVYFLNNRISPEILRNKIKERSRSYLIRKNNRKIDVLVGQRGQLMRYKFIEQIKKGIKEIKGLPVTGGRVRGRVCLVKKENDLKKVKNSSILVAIFTRPHYLIAMRKAIAIITDEGDLTCHAAIISRELSIPCIVGTKIATKVLKDGDKVEIDTEQGVIKKL